MCKLDLRTKVFLFITGATIEKEKKYTKNEARSNVVYIFSSYDEFQNYFSKYVKDVKEDEIDLSIYAKSKTGAIVAFKGLCDMIITKKRLQEY